MRRQTIAEAGLIAAITTAVAVFGGTEPLSLAAAQVGLLGLGGLVVLSGADRGPRGRFPIVVPAFLCAWAVLEVVPLPRWVLLAMGDRLTTPFAAGMARASVAPEVTAVELLRWISYAAAFYLALVICRRQQAMLRVVTALVVLASTEAIYGVAGFLTGWQPLRRFISVPNAHPVGTYVNRDHFAGLLEMLFPFALALAFARGERVFEQPSQGQRTRLRSLLFRPGVEPFLFWLFLSALMLLGIVCSLSRMGIFSALLATCLVAFLVVTSERRRRVGGLVLTGFLCLAAVLALWMGIEPVINRYAEPMTGRLGIWADTLALIRQSPVLGSGLGTLRLAITPVQTVYVDKVIDHAHNDYLEFAAEWGLPGAVVLFAGIFWVFRGTLAAASRPERSLAKTVATGAAGSLVAMLAHSLVDFNLHIPANALVFAVVLGLAWAASRPEFVEQQSAQPAMVGA